MRKQTPESFWAKVDIRGPNKCWPWTRGHGSNGYPQVRWHGKNCTATRVVMWLEGHLKNLESKDWVLHLCDNPTCCNPSHLQIGDPAENSRQASERGRRNYHGELSPKARFSNKQAAHIRKLYAKGWSQQQIADLYECAQTTISRIVRKEGYQKC